MRGVDVSGSRGGFSAGFITLLALIGWSTTAFAHGARLPFDDWGGFDPGPARCQRAIGRAAAQCAQDTWAARRACRSAQLGGGSCDLGATEAAIRTARRKALDSIDASCSEREAIDLQFLGSFDLQGDLISFCSAWDAAATSAVFDVVGGRTVSSAERLCVDAAADAATRVMQFSFRTRRQCMDRIAAIDRQAPNRAALLDDARHRIGTAYVSLAARLAARCAAVPFSELYRRSPHAFVEGLGGRADCIGSQFYIQDAVLCPDAICGNGIVEPGEDCDDGNIQNGDDCPKECRR